MKEENVGVSKQSGFMLRLKVPPLPTSGAFFGRRSNFWSGSNASESDLAHHHRPAQQYDAMVHLYSQQYKSYIHGTSVGSSFTLASRFSSENSGMRSCRKCETCNQADKRAVKSVKLKTALKSIRPTNFHTLVNQGFCGSACAFGPKEQSNEDFSEC